MTHRLFIAFPLTSGLKKKIAFLEEKIEKKLGQKLNWIPLDNLHLTILFLGHLSFEDALKTEQILDNFPWGDESLKKAFDLRLEKIDFGPPGKTSMIWIYIKADERLLRLRKILELELKSAGVKYKEETRELLPHINLCRLKSKKIKISLKEELKTNAVFTKLVLYESLLKPSGAQYEPRKIIELKTSDEDSSVI